MPNTQKLLRNWQYWIAPTVAEMIDLLPDVIDIDYNMTITKYYEGFLVGYVDDTWMVHDYFYLRGELPNTLAEMIILLHEKGFKLFDK